MHFQAPNKDFLADLMPILGPKSLAIRPFTTFRYLILGITGSFTKVTKYSDIIFFYLSILGEERPPLLQRMFWCITIGAVTSVLLIYEENVGRSEVSSFVIIAGLPFALLLCFCAISIWR